MIEKNKRYFDEFHNLHAIENEIASGGQGVVYRTTHSDVVLKFSFEGSAKKLISDEEKVKRYKENLTQIRMLPIPRNLHLAVPVASLEEHAGYVMKLLDGMVSFNYFRPGADENVQQGYHVGRVYVGDEG